METITKAELETMRDRAARLSKMCFKSDSLFRGIAWSKLAVTVAEVIKEEEIHDFKFPSPHKP